MGGYTDQAELAETSFRGLLLSVVFWMTVAAAVVFAIAYAHEIARSWDHFWSGFLHVTGSDAPGSVEYNFWSGFGSDLGEAALLAVVAKVAHKHNCHVKGCWRFGIHPYEKDGVTHKLCKNHHPLLGKGHRLTHLDLQAHALWSQMKPNEGNQP